MAAERLKAVPLLGASCCAAAARRRDSSGSSVSSAAAPTATACLGQRGLLGLARLVVGSLTLPRDLDPENNGDDERGRNGGRGGAQDSVRTFLAAYLFASCSASASA